MATTAETAVAERFLAALAARDYPAVEACFAADARLRVLVPERLRDDQGPQAIAARFRFWYEDLDDFELVESEVDGLSDRLRIRYRLTGTDPEEGGIVVEQEGYAAVDDGRITLLNLVCSGWRPPV